MYIRDKTDPTFKFGPDTYPAYAADPDRARSGSHNLPNPI